MQLTRSDLARIAAGWGAGLISAWLLTNATAGHVLHQCRSHEEDPAQEACVKLLARQDLQDHTATAAGFGAKVALAGVAFLLPAMRWGG